MRFYSCEMFCTDQSGTILTAYRFTRKRNGAGECMDSAVLMQGCENFTANSAGNKLHKMKFLQWLFFIMYESASLDAVFYLNSTYVAREMPGQYTFQ